MEYFIAYIGFCGIVGWVANSTKLGFASGFLLSLILTPIAGFIICLLYPDKPNQERIPKDIGEIQDKLAKLDSMKENKAISEKEYQFLRKQILG